MTIVILRAVSQSCDVLIICLAAFTLLLIESTVAVHRMVNFSLVVFSQITEKLLARMTVTGRTKAKSTESSNLTDCLPVRPGL